MKKVLVITYYWPPAGGAGVQRTLKFTKYLINYNWLPYVLTVEKPDAPNYDESLFKDVRDDIKVVKTKALEPFSAYKKFTGKKEDDKIPADVLMRNNSSFKEEFAKFIRANLFVPDAKIGWTPYAVKEGEKIIKNEKIDIIYASSPPATVALIARRLSERTGVPYILDFRDPWLEIVYNQTMKRSKPTVAIDSLLERKALRDAAAVVTVSAEIKELFEKKVSKQKYFVIPNGFDEEDFPKIEFPKNEKFTIAYTGVMSPDRVPYALLKALARFKEEGITNIKLNFAGKFADEFYAEIERLGIEDYFNITGFVPHDKSVEILLSSDALLLVINNLPNNKGVLTGKMFEYLGCRKPIYGIGPENGEAAKILQETKSGVMIDYYDEEKAYEKLKEFYADWENNVNRFEFLNDKYSRKRLTEKLSEIFDEVAR